MKGYVVAEIEVTDPTAYEEYRRQVLATIEKFGGRFLVRGGNPQPLEGGWTPKRMVVLEFPSPEQAAKWYRSEDYKPLIDLRQRASRGRLVLLEGG